MTLRFKNLWLAIGLLAGLSEASVATSSATAVFAPDEGAEESALNRTVREIEALDIQSLAPGRHTLSFRAGFTSTGQPVHIPVHVLKGADQGPRFMVTAGVHGDELNGIATLHALFDRIDVAQLKGTMVGIPGLNQPGLVANNRHFVGASGGGYMADLNRTFPGKARSGDSAERYVARIWNNIIKDNADFAVDLHTQTRGSTYPLFVFADFDNDAARQMAIDLMPDVIKIDPGQRGTLETSLLARGIPAVTFEIGGPKTWQPDLIDRAVEGLLNLMVAAGMIEGDRQTPADAPFIGKETTNIYADIGGYAYLHVGLRERVTEGQHVATLKDAYGQVVQRYYAPTSGYILSVATDPLREPGSMLVRILH